MSDAGLAYIAPGIRVSWVYTHAIGRNRMTRSKSGVVIRTLKHRNPFYAQQVAVLFDGNKTESIVQIANIIIAEQK